MTWHTRFSFLTSLQMIMYNINGKSSCTVRDYVNELENELSKAHHIYKGESDDEDLSHFERGDNMEEARQNL